MNIPKIDCLIIGHNEMKFPEYEKTIRHMGLQSGAYRDLNMNFIRYNNKPYTVSEMVNILLSSDLEMGEKITPITIGESFSASISYLGTYLSRRGFTFDYVNSFQEHKEQLKEKLLHQHILTVVIPTTLYVSVFPIVEIIRFVREYAATAKIILGGPFVSGKIRTLDTQNLEYLFNNTISADIYVNSSQGEEALVRVITALKDNRSLHSIPNIIYMCKEGMISTPIERENNQLSKNMVDWALFSGNTGKYVNVRSAISCPFACSFCGFPLHAGKYQTAAVEEVEAELKSLEQLGTVESVHFVDDTFNVPAERFKQLLKMMIRNQFSFLWHSYFRCQYADQETVELMKESGCKGVFLGIESGSQQILKNMNKAADIEKYLQGIKLLKEQGIVTFGNFIIGFPGETEHTVQETKGFIEQSGLDFYRTQLWYCEPITPIWKQREQYQIKGNSFEWSHITMDTQGASDKVEEIFLSTDGPTWIPQYNFDFATLWHLVHRGMTIEQVKQFLGSFNRGIQEKLEDPRKSEASYEVIHSLKKICCTSMMDDSAKEEETVIADSEADFDFL
jgi:anaerobic magnesium-protoporphyrin IX monomethyl ester cyclase